MVEVMRENIFFEFLGKKISWAYYKGRAKRTSRENKNFVFLKFFACIFSYFAEIVKQINKPNSKKSKFYINLTHICPL